MKTLPAPPPLQPASTLPYSTLMWTEAQRVKIAELTAHIIGRARKPHLKRCMLMKCALEFGTRELAASRKLLALYTT